jgi:hypothetical protein
MAKQKIQRPFLYVVSERMTVNPPHIWSDARFAFHAADELDAKRLAYGWAQYHGHSADSVTVTLTAEKDLPYTVDFIHDDWVQNKG